MLEVFLLLASGPLAIRTAQAREPSDAPHSPDALLSCSLQVYTSRFIDYLARRLNNGRLNIVMQEVYCILCEH